MNQDAPGRDDLPLPDYDHLPVGSLAHRIRSLGAEDLQALLAYEHAHGDRTPVVQVLQTRLDEVERGAELSSGDAAAPAPETAVPPSGTSAVSPQTQGPVQNAPSHGTPTNPAQPRT